MADIQVKRGTSVSVTETFSLDGVAQDLDTGLPVVVATAPDGTTTLPTVSGSWAGPPARTTGQYRVVLAAQPEVTWRDLTWTGTIGGLSQTLESRVEWIGQPLFTLSAFRALRVAGGTPFATTATPLYTDAQIQDTRAGILDEMTEALGFSPVPRFYREVVSVGWGGDVLLRELQVTKILSVTAGGVAQVAANFYVDPGGRLLPVTNYQASPWTAYGYGSVVVEYRAGWDRVKGIGSHIAMIWAAAQLNPSGFSSAVSVAMPDGSSYTYEPSETGRDGFKRPSGIRQADRWFAMHASPSVAVA